MYIYTKRGVILANHSLRSRQWFLVTYNNEEDFKLLLESCVHWAYIYHNKDNNEPHYHIICVFKNARAFNGVKSLVSGGQNTLGEIVRTSLTDCFSYLTHSEHSDKEQYCKLDIKCDNLLFWESLEQSENDSTTDSLIDDILSGLPLRLLARRYGRDFMRNCKAYLQFARMVLRQERGAVSDYQRFVEFEDFNDLCAKCQNIEDFEVLQSKNNPED